MITNRMHVAELYKLEYPFSALNTPLDAFKDITWQMFSTYSINNNFNGPIPFDLIFFSIGYFLIFKSTFISIMKKSFPNRKSILFFWLLIAYVTLIFYLKNLWDRYFIPLIHIITIIQAYGIAIILRSLWNKHYSRTNLFMINSMVR